MTGAYVSQLETDASDKSITGVQIEHAGVPERYTSDIAIVACGALSSALLLL